MLDVLSYVHFHVYTDMFRCVHMQAQDSVLSLLAHHFQPSFMSCFPSPVFLCKAECCAQGLAFHKASVNRVYCYWQKLLLLLNKAPKETVSLPFILLEGAGFQDSF